MNSIAACGYYELICEEVSSQTPDFQQKLARFLAKLYQMPEDKSLGLMQEIKSNRNLIEEAVAEYPDGELLEEDWNAIKQGAKKVGAGVAKFAGRAMLGMAKLAGFNLIASTFGWNPYAFTIVANVIIGILGDTLIRKTGIRKAIKNAAVRVLTAAAFTLFMDIIGGGEYSDEISKGANSTPQASAENHGVMSKVGNFLHRKITGQDQEAFKPTTDIAYKQPMSPGAAVREYIPGMAKNPWDANGQLVDPQNASHVVTRPGAVGRFVGDQMDHLGTFGRKLLPHIQKGINRLG